MGLGFKGLMGIYTVVIAWGYYIFEISPKTTENRMGRKIKNPENELSYIHMGDVPDYFLFVVYEHPLWPS